MTANDKTGVGSGSGEWQTPPDDFARWHRQFSFDIDLFASPANALCDYYCTDEGLFYNDGYEHHLMQGGVDGFTYAPHEGGLSRGFGNPPFSMMEEFAESYIRRRDAFDLLFGVVPASVETQWYRDLERHATMFVLPYRIQFVHPPFECSPTCQTRRTPHKLGEKNGGSPGGHALVLMRPSWMDR